MTNDGSCPNLNAMHGHDVHVVALDGDKLKPREDQRKRPMPAEVQCFENNTLNHSEVCRTLTGNHDDRVTDTGTSIVISMAQNTRNEVRIVGGDGQIAGALPAEPGMNQQTFVTIAREGAEGE